MAFQSFPVARRAAIGLLGGWALVAAPAGAAGPARAGLVHCDTGTCVRLSGHRPGTTATVAIAGRALAVEGGRRWQATVPLDVARNWPIARGYAVHIVVADPERGMVRSERVMLPPGALGSRHEIASLVIGAR